MRDLLSVKMIRSQCFLWEFIDRATPFKLIHLIQEKKGFEEASGCDNARSRCQGEKLNVSALDVRMQRLNFACSGVEMSN